MIIDKRLALVCVLAAMLVLPACAKKAEEPKVVAQIGPYTLYESDFRHHWNMLSSLEKAIVNTESGRRAFLEQLIDQEVLLQEAQEQNIDKEKEFRQLIEMFWAQAMIEELIIRKTKDVLSSVSINEQEMEYYDKYMSRRIHARVVMVTDEPTAYKVLNEETLTYEEGLKIQHDSDWNWYGYEEIDHVYRDLLFSMEKGEKKLIFNQEKGWVVVFVKGYEERDAESREQLQQKLKETLQQEKELKVLDQWIKQLRLERSIVINEEVLNKVNLSEKA